MDLHTILIAGHVIGTALGLGGAVVAEAQSARAFRDGTFKENRALLHVDYFIIRLGLALLVISGIGLVVWHLSQGNNWVLTSEKLLLKEILVAVILANAYLLTKHWIPFSLGASISLASWLYATVLGVWHTQLSMGTLVAMYAGLVIAILIIRRLLAGRQ
ncbi:hypothetical protein KW797_01610 [Candidatus Parcubacteria bacterium]|nr:hypothetical protein [Candidatus Parcubacteria bacterium]